MRRSRIGRPAAAARIGWLLAGLVGAGLVVPEAHAAGEKRARKPASPSPPAATQPDSTPPAAAAFPEHPVPADSARAAVEGEPVGNLKPLSFDDLVRFGQNVHIHEDEVVKGDVVLLGGDLHVEGRVEGGAVVLGGNIEIGRRAHITGEAISIGGQVDAATGADVRGGNVSLSFLPRPWAGKGDWQRAQRFGALLGDGLQTVLWLVLAGLFVLFGSRTLYGTTAVITRTPWRCLGLGILALTGGLFSVVMLVVLLALTLVGLPLALLLALSAVIFLAAAQVVGLTRFGAGLVTMFRLRTASTRLTAGLGVAAMMLPKVVSDLLRFGEPSQAVVALRFIYGALVILTLAAGVGALVMARIEARRVQPPAWRSRAVPRSGATQSGSLPALRPE